ncbi:hypothetical protein [Paraherbaspirillum soli]|uniref:Flagella basal body P-ring formation protein FlgA C-terminal domain-containing protein n=1 Tax=Paraherbaspirillum soli TaxID=631222 RepID=A0ABW0MEW3_9BURK
MRLADVAELGRLPAQLRMRAESLVVAQLPAGALTADVPVAAVAERARLQLPVLIAWLPVESGARIHIVREAGATGLHHMEQASEAQCVELLHPLKRNQAITAGDIQDAACNSGERDAGNMAATKASVRYDAAGRVVRASADLAAGAVLPTMFRGSLAQFRSGDPLQIASRIGPVVAERTVTAMQDGAPGRGAFVKSKDGEIFSARLPAYSAARSTTMIASQP